MLADPQLERVIVCTSTLNGSDIIGPVQHFIVTIEGPGWTDFDEVELPRPPNDGETIETKFGICVVTHPDLPSSSEQQDGKILCRLS